MAEASRLSAVASRSIISRVIRGFSILVRSPGQACPDWIPVHVRQRGRQAVCTEGVRAQEAVKLTRAVAATTIPQDLKLKTMKY